jgi:hypothetical protein
MLRDAHPSRSDVPGIHVLQKQLEVKKRKLLAELDKLEGAPTLLSNIPQSCPIRDH